MVEEKREITLFDSDKQLNDILDLNHPLIALSDSIDWESIEIELSEAYPSKTGRPNKPIRMMVGLHYLRYMFDLSDESIVWNYIENPYYQYFCGEKTFQHTFPIDRSSMSKFRERLKKKKLYKLLQETIKSGFKTKVIKPKSIERIVIDSTVQEKNIAYPTDAKLYYKALLKLAALAKRLGIKLRQSYVSIGKQLFIKYQRYNHAKQFKRKRAALKKLKNRLGRVYREILRKADHRNLNFHTKALELLSLCKRLLTQKRNSTNKLYSLHESETVCISKGKAHKRYEFGNKSSFVTTSKECFILHANAFKGNPYDGHTLIEELEITKETIKPLTSNTIQELYADKGYKGHGYKGDTVVVLETTANRKKFKHLVRRSSIEPIIGHMKSDHRLKRNFLKGTHGNLLNTVLSACGLNLKKIYNKFRKEFIKALFQLNLTVNQMMFLMDRAVILSMDTRLFSRRRNINRVDMKLLYRI